MSRKESSLYRKSSFDAVESTRKLSEEIASGPTSTSTHHSPQGTTVASTTHEQKTDHRAGGDLDDAINHVVKANNTKGVFKNDNNNNGYIKLSDGGKQTLSPLLDESPCTEEAITTEHLLRFNISRETIRKNSENGNVVSGEIASLNRKVHDEVKSPRVREQMFDQRSESDSDLSSPDDFSDGELSDQSNGAIKRHDSVTHQRNESEGSQLAKKGGSTSSVSHGQRSSVNGDANENNQTSGQIDSSSMKSFASAKTKASVSSDNKIFQGNSHTGSAVNGTSPDTDSVTNDTQYAQLTDQEIGDKLKDDDILRQGEMLDTVREVSVTNLNKLQHLQWNDPALRRLFMKPRLTTKEVKSVKVDPDIKNMVNEFLKTNVAENFVISRVLRENYATFYSWLASHLQTERNAWTTRFAQALDQADQERKAALQTRNQVMEAAVRLRVLAKTSSNILFGIPDKSDELFFREDLSRRHGKPNHVTPKAGTMPRGAKSQRGYHSTDAGYSSDSNVGVSRLDSKSQCYKATQGMRKVLAPSNYRSVKVADSKPGKVNYDSDPGESFADSKFINDDSDCEPIHSGVSRHSRVSERSKVQAKRNVSNAGTVREHTDAKVDFSGFDLSGLLLDGDKDTDWNRVLLDNVEVLYEICDTLLVDRKACLQLVKSNPKRCESLVDAVSTFIRHRQHEMSSKREIEKRLKTLESENRALQDEMSTLQKTLADKNRDALNLQSQLDRLESMMNDHTVPKMNKCVGTGDEMFPAVFKNNLTVGSNKTPRQANHNQTNMPKLTRSPRLTEREIKTKTVELPSVNGMSNVKHHRNKREPHCPNPGGSTRENLQQEMSSSPDIGLQTHANVSDSSPPQPTTMVREPSLIEISEEKLKTLKHRAKKLEDSLHDAISSMGKHNKPKHQASGSFTDSNVNSSIGPFYNQKRVSSIRQAPKTFRNWQKASFEVNSKAPEKVATNISSNSKVVLVTRSDSFSKHKDIQDGTPDVRITLNSEPSSLLEGRLIPSDPHDLSDPIPASSSLRMTSEKTHGIIIHSSRSNFDDSEDERSRHDYDGILTYRRQPDHVDTTGLDSHASTKRRTRVRHNASSRMLGPKQMVSKCLRCQKLFSPNDNHKLACCYHTKDKERLEHYDQSGMLIRVIHAWKCCNEPQEVEGCCYGQHV